MFAEVFAIFQHLAGIQIADVRADPQLHRTADQLDQTVVKTLQLFQRQRPRQLKLQHDLLFRGNKFTMRDFPLFKISAVQTFDLNLA